MSYDLRQLQHFAEVARHGNYARAAEALGLAQPTLTRSIQALERQVGARLLDRGRAGATPTALGTELLGMAEALLRQAADTEREMRLLVGVESGHLRIGAGAYAADVSVAAATARFLQSHRGISVDLTIEDWTTLIARVLNGHIDLAVAEATDALDDDRLDVELLPRHRGVLFCRSNHPLLESMRPLSMPDLALFPFVATTLPDRLKRAFADINGRVNAPARHRAPTFEIIRRIVLETDSVAAAIPVQIAPDIAAGRVSVLPIGFPGLHTAYGIIRQARRTLSPVAQSFLAELRQVEAELAGDRPPTDVAGTS